MEHDKNQDQQTAAPSPAVSKRYRVVFDRANCIGAFSCVAVNPKYWEIAEDGKARFVGGTELPNGDLELEIGEDEFAKMLEAAQVCPVNVIHIFDLRTGEKII